MMSGRARAVLTSDKINRTIYATAWQTLKDMLPAGMDEGDLDKYWVSNSIPHSMEDVYIQLIASAQNSQGMPNTIKFWDDEKKEGYSEREEGFRIALENYDIKAIARKDSDAVLSSFKAQFGDAVKVSPRGYWRRWSNSVVDSARFLEKFQSLEDFKGFVDSFQYNASTKAALPLYLAANIKGIGFTLACDFLKELGYQDYPKPDVHMIDICANLSLSEPEPMQVYETLIKLAADCGEKPYKVDKVLWLVCTGNFHKERDGSGIKVNGRKTELIEAAKQKLAGNA